ncbi:MAG: hypothetical protein JXA67_17620 [Micromonosporaceae bacterium]|nr:hypothetical protein [Micromonosporaceae bacterium]
MLRIIRIQTQPDQLAPIPGPMISHGGRLGTARPVPMTPVRTRTDRITTQDLGTEPVTMSTAITALRGRPPSLIRLTLMTLTAPTLDKVRTSRLRTDPHRPRHAITSSMYGGGDRRQQEASATANQEHNDRDEDCPHQAGRRPIAAFGELGNVAEIVIMLLP